MIFEHYKLSKTATVASVRSSLERLSTFLSENDSMISVCMVDYIIDDFFSNAISPELQVELSNLTEEEICMLPTRLSGASEDKNRENDDSELGRIIREISKHTLESLGVTKTRDEVDSALSNVEVHTRLDLFDRIMGEKKLHEVAVLSDVLGRLCSREGVSSLVDLGSGKGYLGQVLAALHGLGVLGVDAAEGNTDGARKRQRNLERKWDALFRRADLRSKGEKPPMRGKNWKSKKRKDEEEPQQEDDVISGESSQDNSQADDVDPLQQQGGAIKTVTQFVDTETDLPGLLSEHLNAPEKAPFGVVGLHTCGNLAPNSLKVFLSNPRCSLIANVGCCYHHLDEEFYRNKFLTEAENDAMNAAPAFPMSSLLREKEFQLGRNARMVAGKPADRMADKKELPSEALFWRAALQQLFLTHAGQAGQPELRAQQLHVGKLASKADGSFVKYARMALNKFNLSTNLTDDEIATFLVDQSSKHRLKLLAFYQLRSLFGPLVEGAILLDRLLFLLEQDCVEEAILAQLFDPVISPRCYALIAIKKKTGKE